MNSQSIRYINFFILVCAGLCWVTSAKAQEVTCTLDLPSSGMAGTEIPVKVTIHKGQNHDFARFQQKVPVGFDVRPVKTGNADFSFRDQSVDFIWLKLPETETIVLEYVIIPGKDIKGSYAFSGRFSFIHDNDRDEVDLPESQILINAYAAGATVSQEQPLYDLAVFRSKPVMQASGGGWLVHLLVSRAEVEKLARIEENIPAGYRAENVDGKDAIFSYKDGKLKYIWMDLPEDHLFMVTYRVIPENGVSGEPVMDGFFSFMDNNEPVNIPIINTDQAFSSALDYQGLQALYAQLMGNTPENVVSEGAKSAESLLNENKPGQATEIVPHKPETQQGIYFRVQIIATSKPIQIEAFFKAHNIPGKIYREHTEGLYKYTTGSFTVYRDARGFIEDLHNKTDIIGAFVTAYRDDQRISVKEALDATGQRWFK